DVDPELLHQALMNIMDFCIKAMQGGGTLALFARMSTVRDKAEIGLKDNGPGLKSESMETLFKPFRTSRMSTRGLSMAISRVLVEMHGGTIEVESSQGAGTTFRIILPLYREENA
ncbi:sensor histidine kinase, partial [Nitrospirota bacterium]